MPEKIEYLTAEKVIEINKLVLIEIRVKKKDAPKLLSKLKLEEVLTKCENEEGSLAQKAAILLEGLTKAHAFASGNRRTAFVAAKAFVDANKGEFGIADDPENAKALQGIREGFYTKEEIIGWIEHGKIREFAKR